MRRILIALALAALPSATRAQSTRGDVSQLLTQAAGEARQKGHASEARVECRTALCDFGVKVLAR
ncbi:hypothetical protein [Longimicrobium sp.]|jgi:hypothetical protein|uniref:hypothetical protein n=1 Tax=Longimicrobium sp. TaxID=2029185 RepID=UPI002EDAF5D5